MGTEQGVVLYIELYTKQWSILCIYCTVLYLLAFIGPLRYMTIWYRNCQQRDCHSHETQDTSQFLPYTATSDTFIHVISFIVTVACTWPLDCRINTSFISTKPDGMSTKAQNQRFHCPSYSVNAWQLRIVQKFIHVAFIMHNFYISLISHKCSYYWDYLLYLLSLSSIFGQMKQRVRWTYA